LLFWHSAPRLRLSILLLSALVLNALRPAYAAYAMQQVAQVGATNDLMLICTGKGMKWASLSLFEQTGQLQYVESPPELGKLQLQHCPLYYLSDLQDDELYIVADLVTLKLAYEADVFVALQQANRLYHPCPHGRAPPQV